MLDFLSLFQTLLHPDGKDLPNTPLETVGAARNLGTLSLFCLIPAVATSKTVATCSADLHHAQRYVGRCTEFTHTYAVPSPTQICGTDMSYFV